MAPLAIIATPAHTLRDARVLLVDEVLGLDAQVKDVFLVAVSNFGICDEEG